MDLKERLPKLGEDDSGGVVFGVDQKEMLYTTRPDYAKFKTTKKYKREIDCVSVIVGFSTPGVISYECANRCAKIMRESQYAGLDRIGDPCFSFYSQSAHLFAEIREIIDIGIATKEIGPVVEKEVNNIDEELYGHPPFSPYRWFEPLSFLNWMKENGYPIPDELAIDRDPAGNLVWREATPMGVDLNALPEEEKVETAKKLKKQGKSAGEIIGLLWIDYEKFDKNQTTELAWLLKRNYLFTNPEIAPVLYPGDETKSAITKINRNIRALKIRLEEEEKVTQCSGVNGKMFTPEH